MNIFLGSFISFTVTTCMDIHSHTHLANQNSMSNSKLSARHSSFLFLLLFFLTVAVCLIQSRSNETQLNVMWGVISRIQTVRLCANANGSCVTNQQTFSMRFFFKHFKWVFLGHLANGWLKNWLRMADWVRWTRVWGGFCMVNEPIARFLNHIHSLSIHCTT